MNYIVHNFSTSVEQLSVKEITRYMGLRTESMDAVIESRILRLMPEFLKNINCRACWMELSLSIEETFVDMDLINAKSRNLSSALSECSSVVIFAATIGSGVERLTKAAFVSAPTDGLIYDAMGSAAIEAFCDQFCDYMGRLYPNYRLCPRFSPGYGDLSLDMQSDLLRVLDAQRKIGLVLSDSILLIPQKSVTAIIGLKAE